MKRISSDYKFRMRRVGVELEGAWRTHPLAGKCLVYREYARDTVNPTDATRFATMVCGDCPVCKHWHQDYSLQFNAAEKLLTPIVGELTSDPLTRPELWKFIKENYPHYINRTCGLHVHMSFRYKADYERLMDVRFYEHFMRGLTAFGRQAHIDKKHLFWERIAGLNHFCQDSFKPDLQSMIGDRTLAHRPDRDNRYTALNYPWAAHQTLEVRVLPAFDNVRTSIRAIRKVLNLTEEFLWESIESRREPLPSYGRAIAVPVNTEIAPPKVELELASQYNFSETYEFVGARSNGLRVS